MVVKSENVWYPYVQLCLPTILTASRHQQVADRGKWLRC